MVRLSKNRKAKKLGPNFSKNKKAFDGVMSHLRHVGNVQIEPIGAANLEGGGKPAAKNPAKPTMVDFRCDVFLAVKAAIPDDIDLVAFHLAYTLFDSDDAIEREVHAQKTLGDRRHSVEQRLGAEFIRRKVWPVRGKGYFWSPRIERPR